MKNTPQRPTGLIRQVCWLMVRFVVVVIFGCLVSISLSMLMVKLQGESAITVTLNHHIQEANELLIRHPSESENLLINRWIQVRPIMTASPPLLLPIIAKDRQEQVWGKIKPFVDVGLLSIELSLLRFEIIMHWLGSFLILSVVALSDGLSQRMIRRVSGGHESALIYHTAKSLVMLTLLSAVFLEIVLPISLNLIGELMIGLFILSAWFVQVTAKQFKKYL